MKLLLPLTLAAALFAADGRHLFEQNCKACHIDTKPTPAMRSKLKAPPIMGVMWHVKQEFKSKDEAIAFITEYIANPTAKKAICPSIKRFGLMPALALPKEDRRKIAEYLYDTFPPKGFKHPKMGFIKP